MLDLLTSGVCQQTGTRLKAAEYKVQETCKCADEMELSVAPNTICANAPWGEAQCKGTLFCEQDFSGTVMDSTQLYRGYSQFIGSNI